MLHAAAMLIGTCVLWLLATQRWNSADGLTLAVASALACVFLTARFGGIGGGFAEVPRAAALITGRAVAVLRAAFDTARAAAAGDVTLQPGLIRVRTRSADPEVRTAFAAIVSATPGMAAVELDGEGALVHVMNENDVEAADLARLEDIAAGGRRS